MTEKKEKVVEIIQLFVPDTILIGEETIYESLHAIVSDSVQAIHFISLIENEFEIEIDDEFINYDFFSSIENIINAIEKSISDSN